MHTFLLQNGQSPPTSPTPQPILPLTHFRFDPQHWGQFKGGCLVWKIQQEVRTGPNVCGGVLVFVAEDAARSKSQGLVQEDQARLAPQSQSNISTLLQALHFSTIVLYWPQSLLYPALQFFFKPLRSFWFNILTKATGTSFHSSKD